MLFADFNINNNLANIINIGPTTEAVFSKDG